MPSVRGRGYHHEDLGTTLVAAATRMLNAGEPFSLRSVAREAGVSHAAPYRHFANRSALEAAVATKALHELKASMARSRPCADPAERLTEFAVAYVEFARERPAMFRLVFDDAASHGTADRRDSFAEIRELLEVALAGWCPEGDVQAIAAAAWAFAHGMACQYLDQDHSPTSEGEIADSVRAALAALLSVSQS